MRYDVLHPYKAIVIQDLATVLDDPKRSVRKEAVDARWDTSLFNTYDSNSHRHLFAERTGE